MPKASAMAVWLWRPGSTASAMFGLRCFLLVVFTVSGPDPLWQSARAGRRAMSRDTRRQGIQCVGG